MVEGGAQVISRLLEIRSYVDFVIITVSPMWVGADGLDAMTMTEGHVSYTDVVHPKLALKLLL